MPVCLCLPVSVHQPAPVFIFLCIHMCTGHGWLCTCLLAIVHAIVHSLLTLSLSLYMSVFPWAFSVSLYGLVLLIRLCVWGHGCRVGLHRGDPETDRGQLLVLHSSERKKKKKKSMVGVTLKRTNFICALLCLLGSTKIFTGYHLSEDCVWLRVSVFSGNLLSTPVHMFSHKI